VCEVLCGTRISRDVVKCCADCRWGLRKRGELKADLFFILILEQPSFEADLSLFIYQCTHLTLYIIRDAYKRVCL
jgi:hypothetical protein